MLNAQIGTRPDDPTARRVGSTVRGLAELHTRHPVNRRVCSCHRHVGRRSPHPHTACGVCSYANARTSPPARRAARAGRARRCAEAPCAPRRRGRSGACGCRPGTGAPSGPVAGVVLLGGRVQGPVRVIEVRAGERAHVGAPGEHDRVDVVVGGDGADGDRRRCRPRCGSGRRTGSGSCGRRRAAPPGHLTGGDVDDVAAVLGQHPARTRPRRRGSKPPGDPVGGRDAHAHRLVGAATPPGRRRRPPSGKRARSSSEPP